MKVRGKLLWKHVGDNIYITEKYADEYLPQGVYIIESLEDYGLVLIKNGIDYILEYDEDDEFEVSTSHIEENIQEIYEYKLKKILRLSNEGWFVGAHITDITSELHELEVVKNLVKIIKD